VDKSVHDRRNSDRSNSARETLAAVGRVEPKATREHRSERTAVRERGAERGNARIDRIKAPVRRAEPKAPR
jgi:hypothetical protein